jgi:hypothetical protein
MQPAPAESPEEELGLYLLEVYEDVSVDDCNSVQSEDYVADVDEPSGGQNHDGTPEMGPTVLRMNASHLSSDDDFRSDMEHVNKVQFSHFVQPQSRR